MSPPGLSQLEVRIRSVCLRIWASLEATPALKTCAALPPGCARPAGTQPSRAMDRVRDRLVPTETYATICVSTTAAKAWRRSQTLYSIATVVRGSSLGRLAWLSTSVNIAPKNEDRACAMSQKLTLALLTGLSIALLAVSGLPGPAYGKGHGHSGGHGAHHRAHHGGSSGLWRQSPGSASPGGNIPAGHTGGVGRPGHPTSPAPTTLLPSPIGP